MNSKALQSTELPLDKIATMISLDIPVDKIALSLGCTPDKVRQLIDHSEPLQDLLVEATAKQVQHDIQTDVTLKTIERTLLTKIKELIPSSDSLAEVTGALQKIATVKAAEQKAGAQQAEPGTTLNLQLSHIGEATIQLSLSAENQIESINGRTMAPMPYKATMDILTSKKRPNDAQDIADALEIPGIEDLANESQLKKTLTIEELEREEGSSQEKDA